MSQTLLIEQLQNLRRQRRAHCWYVALNCNLIARQYNQPDRVTVDEVYRLFDSVGWKCVITGQKHSAECPLILEHIYKLGNGRIGRNVVSNLRPVSIAQFREGKVKPLPALEPALAA
jgi:hypothetical protein